MSRITGKYFFKTKETDNWTDFVAYNPYFDILSVKGLDSLGAPMNIFTQQWVNSDSMDVYVPDTVHRETNAVEINFIVWNKYSPNATASTISSNHDMIIKQFVGLTWWFKSLYSFRSCQLICQDVYEPTLVHLRPNGELSYITGTLKLTKVSPAIIVSS